MTSMAIERWSKLVPSLVKNSQRHILAEVNRIPQLQVYKPSVENMKNDKTPVVVVLGFGGAQKKHVDKYSQLYSNMGLGSVWYTGERWNETIPTTTMGNHFAPLVKQNQLAISNLADRPLLIHALSMNGARSLTALLRYLEQFGPKHINRIRGVLFDSCPCFISARNMAYGLAVTRPSILGVNLHTNLYTPYAAVRRIQTGLISRVTPHLMSSQTFYHYLKEIALLPKNQTFIYSKSDSVIGYDSVEEFMNRQQSRGAVVDAFRLDESAHVQHLRSDPEGYKQTVRQLIDRSF